MMALVEKLVRWLEVKNSVFLWSI